MRDPFVFQLRRDPVVTPRVIYFLMVFIILFSMGLVFLSP
jgi:hypothetical protein